MNTRFRILVAAAVVAGLSGAQASRAHALAERFPMQCWYEVGVDPPNSCTVCADACLGSDYICCVVDAEQ